MVNNLLTVCTCTAVQFYLEREGKLGDSKTVPACKKWWQVLDLSSFIREVFILSSPMREVLILSSPEKDGCEVK